jgi:RHS repeat-associated protein
LGLGAVQYDPDLGLYYNRARYLDVRSGRFWGMDTDEGRFQDPSTLHKFLYVGSSPVNKYDPSGHFALAAELTGIGVSNTILAQAMVATLVTACALQATISLAIDEGGGDVAGSGPCVPKGINGRRLTVYHYTALPNVDLIRQSGILNASLDIISDANFGPGQYFTDITPSEAATRTKGTLAFALYNTNLKWRYSDVGYVGIELPERTVKRVRNVYGAGFPGRGIYLRYSVSPLKIFNKIVGFGKVPFLQ